MTTYEQMRQEGPQIVQAMLLKGWATITPPKHRTPFYGQKTRNKTEYARAYRDANRERYPEYQRAYKKRMREKRKETKK